MVTPKQDKKNYQQKKTLYFIGYSSNNLPYIKHFCVL